METNTLRVPKYKRYLSEGEQGGGIKEEEEVNGGIGSRAKKRCRERNRS